MEIKELAERLEKKINEKMDEFHKLGKASKKLSEQIDKNYISMAKIYEELEPVHSFISKDNPALKELGDYMLAELKQFKAKEESSGTNK